MPWDGGGLGPLPQSGHCGVGVEGVVSRAGHKSWLGVRPTGSGGTTSRKGVRLAAGLPRGAGGIAALAPTREGPHTGPFPVSSLPASGIAYRLWCATLFE